MEARKVPLRKDCRVVIHFDYDCFYASVFEAKNPSLRSLPFAVQQKHIIVTCNYEARRRGLHKLQLIRDAKRICPDVVIELGEDISRFRDASKELYNFVKQYSWDGRIERLGFDEVWLDVTDMVDYNMETINRSNLQHSYFQISKEDPTLGFEFDASGIAGHTYPRQAVPLSIHGDVVDDLTLRLCLGSHLALYMRHQVERQKGYTSTVGIATNKLLSKLVGNLNKPKGQTTLIPPLVAVHGQTSNVTTFMDDHEIGKIPGIGFKLAQKLREFILQRPSAGFEFIDGVTTRDRVTVSQVRNHPEIDFEKLEKLLGGPGSPHGIGYKVWCLLHGLDDTEVSQARPVPRQISIEDSYIRLDTMPELMKQLDLLARSLINRMRIDLLGDEDDFAENKDDVDGNAANDSNTSLVNKRWLAHPKTLRLTTRPRLPLLSDGTRQRTMKRISHSCPLPNFVFSLHDSVAALADKLVHETLVNMFRKLHSEKAGWDLTLVNVAVTNMAEAAGESKTANGRNIGYMFKRQEDVLKDFRVTDVADDMVLGVKPIMADRLEKDVPAEEIGQPPVEDEGDETGWDDADGLAVATDFCISCGSHIPSFAMVAHQRFHLPALE